MLDANVVVASKRSVQLKLKNRIKYQHVGRVILSIAFSIGASIDWSNAEISLIYNKLKDLPTRKGQVISLQGHSA